MMLSKLKLPKYEDKFTVNTTYEGEGCSLYGFVVSGVHIEIRGDENDVWYYVRADKVYDDLLCAGYLYAALCLEDALNFIAEYFVPYEEPKEKADNGSAAREEEIMDGGRLGVFEVSSGIQEETGVRVAAGHVPGKFFSGYPVFIENPKAAPGRIGRLGGAAYA